MKTFSLFLLSLLSFSLFAQDVEFEKEVLNQPTQYKKELLASFSLTEIPQFKVEELPQRVLLENGYAKYQIKNPAAWQQLKNDNIPVAVDIIYTKYPRKKEDWLTEYHGLLANRLKALFEIDPSLNSIDITWNIILQTDCYTARETKKLFHGIAIHYISKKEQAKEELFVNDTLNQLEEDPEEEIITNNAPTVEEEPIVEINENDVNDSNILDKIKSELPKKILNEIKNKSEKEVSEIINQYFDEHPIVTKKEDITPDFVKSRSDKVEKFIEQYSKTPHPEVGQMLSRQKDWENALVVMDWTGSMYGFGAEVLKWHLLNFEKSGIQRFVLFNDGDFKATHEKIIGKTGGIYTQEATNIDQLLVLFELVMNNGRGGERPENDVEAILEGLKQFPDAQQVVLIADNRSCVRDLELIKEVKVPVKIILCGYTDLVGANPHYIEIAASTNGSIHTAEQDIHDLSIDLLLDKENLQLTRGNRTVMTIRKDCYLGKYYEAYLGKDWVKKDLIAESPQMKKVYYSMRDAMEKPDSVYRLSLTTKRMEEVPSDVNYLKNLRHADFSYNELTKIDKEVLSRPDLESLNLKKNKIKRISKDLFDKKGLIKLDLSYNDLNRLPKGFEDLSLLQELNLSHNLIKKLPKDFPNLRHIKVLELQYNQIEKLPEDYSGWRRLEKLDLSHNEIELLPYRLKLLKRLKYFDASHNQIGGAINSITGMRKLNYLNLSHNNIEKVPSGLGNLKEMTKLDLSHNKIEDLSRRLGDAQNLIELNLSHNQITKLPTTLWKLRNLKVIDLRGNPISKKEQENIRKMLTKKVMIKF